MCSAQFWGSLARLQGLSLHWNAQKRDSKGKAPNAHFKSGFVIEDSRERSWVPLDQLPIGQPLGGQGQGLALLNLGTPQRENAAQGC